MSDSESPRGMVELFKRACISILVGVVALYFAVSLIRSMWPTLATILGVIGLIGLVAGGIIIYRRMRARW